MTSGNSFADAADNARDAQARESRAVERATALIAEEVARGETRGLLDVDGFAIRWTLDVTVE